HLANALASRRSGARRPSRDLSPARPAPPPLSHAPDRLTQYDRPRRGDPGPWVAWRGLPWPSLLGRGLRFSVLQSPHAGGDPVASLVSLPAPRRGPPRRPRGGLSGRDVPLAERERRPRGEPGGASQPAVGALDPRPHLSPAPRERCD